MSFFLINHSRDDVIGQSEYPLTVDSFSFITVQEQYLI